MGAVLYLIEAHTAGIDLNLRSERGENQAPFFRAIWRSPANRGGTSGRQLPLCSFAIKPTGTVDWGRVGQVAKANSLPCPTKHPLSTSLAATTHTASSTSSAHDG